MSSKSINSYLLAWHSVSEVSSLQSKKMTPYAQTVSSVHHWLSISNLVCHIFMKISTKVLHKRVYSKRGLCGNRFSDRPNATERYKWISTHTSHISLQIWVQFGTADFHVTLLSICDFLENWCNESCTLLRGIHQILPVLSIFSVLPKIEYMRCL